MMYIQSFIKIGLGMKKLGRMGFTDTQTACWCHKPTFIFFKIRKLNSVFQHPVAYAIQLFKIYHLFMQPYNFYLFVHTHTSHYMFRP
jgi:hypothetical protein